MPLKPFHFIGEPITVEYDQPPALEKSPTCPNRFVWNEAKFTVLETLAEWVDYTRRGRFARNMQPQHAAVASRRGSWGVGRFTFQVRALQHGVVSEPRIFELYYDRAPKDVDTRKGSWMLVAEMRDEG